MSSADSAGDDVSDPSDESAANEVKELASRGELAERAGNASPVLARRLHRGAWMVCAPVVFHGLTRGVEFGRGHHRCAAGVEHLEPDCASRYSDDVEATITDLLKNARTPIHNIDGWLRTRLTRATIDGYRRRRGERGAVQRPRMPGWLAKHLGPDPWLSALALDVMVWVGIPATAGTGLWPYRSWTDRRAIVTGDYTGTEQDVVREVEIVLRAMRKNPTWYAKFIERPLGRKEAPLTAESGTDDADERSHLALTPPSEADDTALVELAAVAIDVIGIRIARGEDPPTVVVDVISTVFGSGTGSDRIDRPSGADSDLDESLRERLGDPKSVEQIVRAVLDILRPPDAT